MEILVKHLELGLLVTFLAWAFVHASHSLSIETKHALSLGQICFFSFKQLLKLQMMTQPKDQNPPSLLELINKSLEENGSLGLLD